MHLNSENIEDTVDSRRNKKAPSFSKNIIHLGIIREIYFKNK